MKDILSQTDKILSEIDETLSPIPELDDILRYACRKKGNCKMRLHPENDLKWEECAADGVWYEVSPNSHPGRTQLSHFESHKMFPDLYPADEFLTLKEQRWLAQHEERYGSIPSSLPPLLRNQSEEDQSHQREIISQYQQSLRYEILRDIIEQSPHCEILTDEASA